ncbi:VOC family protein [Cellulomonas terrae]|uniref:Glyoxalase n=1 Tax=Cellulomonas terrae TaxID=311234 RepID=A0A511JLJ3_9CELL|nr:VOC family protein [Cellulomonas terrae]GEL98769.1 glyoxalase [Cellulomonas terrae]
MTTRHLRQPTLDCAEPRVLAEFFRQLLGWVYADGHEETEPAGDDFLLLIDPDRPVRLGFQRSDATVAPWRVGARVHLDLDVDDLDVGHEDAIRLGARPLTGTPEEEGHADDPFRVYADPSGHPFCLCLADQ